MLPIEKKHLFVRKDIALTRLCLVKYLLPDPLEVQYIVVLAKPMHFLTLDLNKKLITSESNSRRSLCKMVAYKVLKSKIEIDMDFFLALILFSLVTIAKEF